MIMRPGQQCAKARFDINDTEDRLIAVEHFISGTGFDCAEFVGAINRHFLVGSSIKNVEHRSQPDGMTENAVQKNHDAAVA